MIKYFEQQFLVDAKAQKKRTLLIYLTVLFAYLVACVVVFIKFGQLPFSLYKDTQSKITILKVIHYSLTAVMLIFTFIFIGIKFNRVKKFYAKCCNISEGIKEMSVGSFLEYDEQVQTKDGVDFKSLVFIEWNKYKNDFFERKVLVFEEKPFPEIPLNANVKYITQGNVLVSYEILSNK